HERAALLDSVSARRGEPMNTRREFLQWMAAAGIGPSMNPEATPPDIQPPTEGARQIADSAIGSLYPFVQEQAVRSPSLSFLQPKFKDPAAWRKRARARLVELLHYTPPKCSPKGEVIAREDHGAYVQEYMWFNTT